ncbi:MAG: 50S ribosomal protein L19 [Chitinophagaceae bacterium]|nr:50S ribosomal protein L19 [Chitinophagaceae bacterium]
MKNKLIDIVEESYRENVTNKKYPLFKAGDTINVNLKITEGAKERIQSFQGIVIQRKNTGTNGETFTVRKIASGVGVERIFPIISPFIEGIELVRKGNVRRARIYYLRGKMGKASKIKEKISTKTKNINK